MTKSRENLGGIPPVSNNLTEIQAKQQEALKELTSRNALMEDQLQIADQLFQNVLRVLDEYEV